MLRSLLFIPGNNPSMIQTADVFEADAIIFDLEDSVSVTEKDNARQLVKQYIQTCENFPSQIFVRINGFDTPFFDIDLEEIVSEKVDMIVLPKATLESVVLLEEKIHKLEKKLGLKKKIQICTIIELASSMLEVENIAAYPRVKAILLGAEDLCSDLEIQRTKLGNEILYARSKIIFAAKAYHIDAIDTPFTDTFDDQGLAEDCHLAQQLGMNAKACIHPRQLETVNEVFSPSKERILWAKKVIDANKKAIEKGLGVFSLDGKMIDKPIIDRAYKTMQKARKFHLIGDENEE